MNRANLYSMQDRLIPGDEVMDRLNERIAAGERVKNSGRNRLYAAVAVCAAIALLAVPVYRALSPAPAKLHSYVTDAQYSPPVLTNTEAGGVTDGGDYHAQPGEEENGGDEIPGGAYVGDTEPLPDYDGPDAEADQTAAINAYQNLMDRFTRDYGYDAYPDWFGGAYLLGPELIVCVANDYVPSEYLIGSDDVNIPGKEFYFMIQEWAGGGVRTDAVGFADVKYSLSFLRDLQARITVLPELEGMTSWGCGVDETANLVELTVPQVDDALLAALAELDPDDDAIAVVAGSAVNALDE